MLEGWKWREDREWARAAWMVAYLLQPWSKHPIKPADLLRPARDEGLEAERLLDPKGTWQRSLDTMYAKQAALRAAGASDGGR